MPIPVVDVDRHVLEEGEDVLHSVAVPCTCFDDNGHPDPNCKEHEIGGYIFLDERPIIGLVTGVVNKKELMASGMFLPSDCIFSPLSDEKIGESDKITFTWALPFGPGEALRRDKLEDFDRLIYAPVKGIVVYDENKARYKEGVDYRFVGKTIEWEWTEKPVEGVKPEGGLKYSIKYHAYMEWIAFYPPVTRISHGEDIGDKVFLRLKHLMEANGG